VSDRSKSATDPAPAMTADPTRSPTLAHRFEFAAIRATVGASRLVSAGLATRIAGGTGRLGYRPLGIRRKVVDANLEIAFPDRDVAWRRRVAADSYAHLAAEGLATLRCAPGGRQAVLEQAWLDGADTLQAALDLGRGVIILAGHLGNWELGVGTIAASGFPLDAVARRQNNPLFDRAILEARAGFGIRCIERSRATRPSLESLRANRLLTLIADQDARRRGIFVPFFSRLASTPRGPAVFALRTGAPMLLMEPLRMADGRLRVRMLPIEVELSGDAEEDTRSITAAYARTLEASVRSAPEQYLWQHRRWKTRPPG